MLDKKSILDQWEAEAKGQKWCGDISQYAHITGNQYAEINQRILALIELVRKKDEALEYYSHPDHYEPWISMAGDHPPGVLIERGDKAREALALTEELK